MDRYEENWDGWIAVWEVPNLSEARVVLALLESQGIDARPQYDPAGSVILGPGSVNPWSGVRIWVPEAEVERALALLQEAVPGEDDDLEEES